MDGELESHYSSGRESVRLEGAKGILEFERTIEIILRSLPRPPAVIADIGGGPGRYASWLARQGYQVEHRDITIPHVLEVRMMQDPRINTAVADARQLDIASTSVDAVLLLGPIYHLNDHNDRLRALSEARRIVRPNGPVFVAAISRWAQRLDGLMTGKIYENYPDALDRVASFEATGQLKPFRPGGFTCNTHRPDEFDRELKDSGLTVEGIAGVEGLPLGVEDLEDRLGDPFAREVIMNCARAIESIPELMGLSSHLLATARRPSQFG